VKKPTLLGFLKVGQVPESS